MKATRKIYNQVIEIGGDFVAEDSDNLPQAVITIQDPAVVMSFTDRFGDKIMDKVVIANNCEDAAIYLKDLAADIIKVRTLFMKELGLKESKPKKGKKK
jgi:hypothetical protein